MKHRVNCLYLALAVLLVLATVGVRLPGARAQQPNRVALVVRFGDGSLATRCVEFGEPEISGYDVLMRSGLNVVAAYYSGEGTAICAIEGTGCPVEECLTCDYPNYWSYWHLVGGAWVYSQVSASGYTVHPDDVEGWSWGAGEPPPIVPFEQVCASPPTDTPVPPTATAPPPTNTPLPAPTATAPPPTPVAWFRLDDNPIPTGTCTNVRWDTSNAQEVYLDGESVSANGSREVCPTVSQEYHLRIMSAAGEQTYTLVLGVTGALPSPTPIPTLTSGPAVSRPTDPAPTIQSTAVTSSVLSASLLPSPAPSSTPQPVAVVSPSPSHTLSPEPTPIPSRIPRSAQPTTTVSQSAPSRPAAGDQSPVSTSAVGYVVFNLIAIGLLSSLIFRILRGR